MTLQHEEDSKIYDLDYIINLTEDKRYIDIITKDINFITCSKDLVNHATVHRNLDVLKHLVEGGADIVYNTYPVNHAAAYGHLDTLKYLVDNGADAIGNKNTINNASSKGHLDVVKYLVEGGADIVNNTYPIDHASANGHLDIVEYLVERGVSIADNEYPITYAAMNGHLDTVKYLAENGAYVACNIAETSLFRGHPKTAIYLMEISDMTCERNSLIDFELTENDVNALSYKDSNGLARYLVRNYLEDNEISPYEFMLMYPDVHSDILMEFIC